jgi:hypothetical protein
MRQQFPKRASESRYALKDYQRLREKAHLVEMQHSRLSLLFLSGTESYVDSSAELLTPLMHFSIVLFVGQPLHVLELVIAAVVRLAEHRGRFVGERTDQGGSCIDSRGFVLDELNELVETISLSSCPAFEPSLQEDGCSGSSKVPIFDVIENEL